MKQNFVTKGIGFFKFTCIEQRLLTVELKQEILWQK
jgi:hypothetical protein